MSGVGSQTGGFGTPQNSTRIPRDVRNRAAIRRSGPATPSEAKPEAEESNPDKANNNIDRREVASEILRRRADTRRIHQQNRQDRSAQADSYSSRNEMGKARGSHVSRFAGQIEQRKLKENQRQNLVENINQEGLGKKAKAQIQAPDLSENQNLAANVAQSSENIDPDAKAKKDLDEKLKTLRRGWASGNNFANHVERHMDSSGKIPKHLEDDVNSCFICEVDEQGREIRDEDGNPVLKRDKHGKLKLSVGSNSLTPSESIAEGAEDPINTLSDMVACDDIDEQRRIRDQRCESYATSAAEKSGICIVRNLNKGPTGKPPEPNGKTIKLSNQEKCIRVANKIAGHTPPWLGGKYKEEGVAA